MKPCNSCGKCCSKYGGGGLSATRSEMDNWEEHRPDIYKHVHQDQIWADPESGIVLDHCPFLYQDTTGRMQLCSIYEQRPEDCRYYPSTISEMVRDECEMIELKDMRNPRQARKDLRTLMSDSHSTFKS